MSILQGANNVTIFGGTYIASTAESAGSVTQHGQPRFLLLSAFKDLAAAAAHAALHNSAARCDAPRCHRNTRAKYLDSLELWMLGTGDEFLGKHLIWLHGAAGAGKSAIMQSLIERCERHGLILGTFFFFRTDPSRNHAEVLIPTLAYQVARAFPAAMDVLGPIILRDPLIFKASVQMQAYNLLVCPILHLIEIGAIENSTLSRRVFVIDGLDECVDPQKQALIIQVVMSIICDHNLPISFLIASRPELAIRSAFQKEAWLSGTFASISLDRDGDAESDIRQFIEDSFLDILDGHPLRHHIMLPWPDPRSVDDLVRKSSGHFIYAATAMKFIASSDEHPERALWVVRGLVPSRTSSPFAQLDTLYMHILTSAKYSNQVLAILRLCNLSSYRNTVEAVRCLYGFSSGDVELFLSDVQSLVVLSPGIVRDTCMTWIEQKHASLYDFFKDAKRSQRIYMTAEAYHASLLERYFQIFFDNGAASAAPLSWLPGEEWRFIEKLTIAIRYSNTANVLRTLIGAHSPQDIWEFCLESFELQVLIEGDKRFPSIERGVTAHEVCRYLCAIRDSTVNNDNVLYIHQFEMYVQLILDDIAKFVHRKPQDRIIPALLFSSCPSGLALARDLVFYFGRRCEFNLHESYVEHFHHLRGDTAGVIHPRSFEAIRRLPQCKLPWSSELAIAMELVLRKIAVLPGSPAMLRYSNPHRQWLRRTKPRKHISLGSPPLSSTNHLVPRKSQQIQTSIHLWTLIEDVPRDKIKFRKRRCRILLKAVIFYLHKAACTAEVAKLVRKLLPKAALWFPKLMKWARLEMDAYLHRWEGSLDSVLEKARLLSINDMD